MGKEPHPPRSLILADLLNWKLPTRAGPWPWPWGLPRNSTTRLPLRDDEDSARLFSSQGKEGWPECAAGLR